MSCNGNPMAPDERLHELKMAGCNLRPRPKIRTLNGKFGYGNGFQCWVNLSLPEAIKIAVKDRTEGHWKEYL